MFDNPPIYTYSEMVRRIPIAELGELVLLQRSLDVDIDFFNSTEFDHLQFLMRDRRKQIKNSEKE